MLCPIFLFLVEQDKNGENMNGLSAKGCVFDTFRHISIVFGEIVIIGEKSGINCDEEIHVSDL